MIEGEIEGGAQIDRVLEFSGIEGPRAVHRWP